MGDESSEPANPRAQDKVLVRRRVGTTGTQASAERFGAVHAKATVCGEVGCSTRLGRGRSDRKPETRHVTLRHNFAWQFPEFPLILDPRLHVTHSKTFQKSAQSIHERVAHRSARPSTFGTIRLIRLIMIACDGIHGLCQLSRMSHGCSLNLLTRIESRDPYSLLSIDYCPSIIHSQCKNVIRGPTGNA